MAVTPGYRHFVIESLEQVFQISARNMFGGVGLYADGVFLALIGDDRLYFKVDDSNRSDLEAAGMEPFRPHVTSATMHYYEVPIDVLEDADACRVGERRPSRWLAVPNGRKSGGSRPDNKRVDI